MLIKNLKSMDVVIPEKGNEDKLVFRALECGYRYLVVSYCAKDFLRIGYKSLKFALSELEKRVNSEFKHQISLYLGCFGSLNEIEKIKQKYSDVVSIAEVENPSRKVFESKKVDIVSCLEFTKGYDFLHQRNSGFNQIIGKLANDRGILIGFNVNKYCGLRDFEKQLVFGRALSNVNLTKKYKVPYCVFSFAKKANEIISLQDGKSLFI